MLTMKEKNKIKILTVLIAFILISIISITIIYIINLNNNNNKNNDNSNNNNNADNIYGLWTLTNQKVINNGNVTYESNKLVFSLNIRNNNLIDICYVNDNGNDCVYTTYTYNNKTLNISDDSKYLNGEYTLSIENNNTIILEEYISDITSTEYYFSRAQG